MTTHDPLASLDGARILLTGGAGLIGSRIHHRLRQVGAQVTVLDNFSAYDDSTFELLGVDRTSSEVVHGDVADEDLIRSLVGESDYVVHAAAYSTVAGCTTNPAIAFASNMAGTDIILRAVAETDSVRRFVFISSAQVYGNGTGGDQAQFFTEEMPTAPLNLYASAKEWGERHTRQLLTKTGTDYTIVRPFSVYGEGQVPKPDAYSWVIAQFSMYAALGQELPLINGGQAIRDRIHVDDAAEGICRAMVAEGASQQILNLGTGTATTVCEAAELVQGHFPQAVVTDAPRLGQDPLGGYASIERMSAALGWTPEISLGQGVARYIAWMNDTPRAIPEWLRKEKNRVSNWSAQESK
ncbi:NAD-dependent epimerase/dehydratase family protein [Nocardiopsis aegyptia]|uniref:NAD-dependent epimerase/dehydratase family protein n=1 Tax=Nocardiopsis aegyptia TaxID=220378 RepID=UPI00366D8C00